MSRVFMPCLSFALAVLLSGTVLSAHVQAHHRAASSKSHFPNVDVLLAWQADGQLVGAVPDEETLASLRQLLVDLNAAYEKLALAEHGRMQQLAHERIAAGALSPVDRVLPAGALGRSITVLDGVSHTVDFFPGMDAELDGLHSQIGALDGLGAELILTHFGSGARFLWNAEHRAGFPGSGWNASSTAPRTCAFITRTRIDDPPPACVSSWGVSYSVTPGTCNPDTNCTGTVSASITERKNNPCSSTKTYSWYDEWGDGIPSLPFPNDPFSSPDGSPAEIDLICGSDYRVFFVAEGITLGTVSLECHFCSDEQ